jgi:hypothetical protein
MSIKLSGLRWQAITERHSTRWSPIATTPFIPTLPPFLGAVYANSLSHTDKWKPDVCAAWDAHVTLEKERACCESGACNKHTSPKRTETQAKTPGGRHIRTSC